MKPPASSFTATTLPLRPGVGKKGRQIKLRANFFPIEIPDIDIHHYDVSITPSMCPPRVNREVVKALVDKNLQNFFKNKRPVFDGKKNLYSIAALPMGKQKQDFDVTVKEQNDERERLFKVSLKWAAQVNMFQLKEALKGKAPMPLSSIQALDVVLRQLPSITCVPVGRSFFSPSGTRSFELGEGREVWFGYHQSIRPSQWKMVINIDVSATAFYKAQPAMDLLSEVINRNVKEERAGLGDADRVRFAKEVKGLKVEITHMGNQRRKYRVINVTKVAANKLTFPLDKDGKTQEITVQAYFKEKYNVSLRYAHLPCLQVGQETRHTYLPIEVCNIVAGQRCIKKLTDKQTSNMIRATAKEAPAREQEIKKLVSQARFNQDVYLKTFGIKVDTNMMEMDGRVLNPPAIEYQDKGGAAVRPKEGRWDMRGKKFVKGIAIKCWTLLVMGNPRHCNDMELKAFANQLSSISTKMGMPIAQQPSLCKYLGHINAIQKQFEQISKMPTKQQLVVVVLPGKTGAYAEVKAMGDRQYSLPTQCIQMKNVKMANSQTLSNLCLKINAKLGGINCQIMENDRPAVLSRPVIFLGADVTHPAPGDDKKPSIAAVVGSLDRIPSKYCASVRVQKRRMEIIEDLKAMTRELLLAFYRASKYKPEQIIMFRDGVSEGQFQQVLQFEMNAIQEACKSLDAKYTPEITFIVVQKRHHARFFAADRRDQVGKSKNIPAGTTVDTVVCHPTEFDFYLCSHAGIQGTSRPAHYHVLYDDHNFTADELQQLAFHLCHTYVRCTRSVSIPAPAYYAHLVAFRARYHLTDKDSGEGASMTSASSADFEKSASAMAEAVTLSAEMKTSMYFA